MRNKLLKWPKLRFCEFCYLKTKKLKEKHVCIIGAGPSGITALKNILDENLKATCFDFNSDVGGNWIYNEKEGH